MRSLHHCHPSGGPATGRCGWYLLRFINESFSAQGLSSVDSYLGHFCQDEKEQLNEFKTQIAGLNRRAKSIIQLKPRNPTTSIKGKLPIQAVCDFKQMEVCKSTYTLIKSHISLLRTQDVSFLVLDRLLCAKANSVHFSTTHSLISGRSSTSQAMRPPYLLCALLCHQ